VDSTRKLLPKPVKLALLALKKDVCVWAAITSTAITPARPLIFRVITNQQEKGEKV
jgi:hypothetical protein